MKKYRVINKDGQRELDEEEFLQFYFRSLFENVHKNIENDFINAKINTTFSEFGKYFKKRPDVIGDLKCMVERCKNRPINSHSISENAVLKTIAKNGQVYTPGLKNRKVDMIKVGISKEASVFPGFCIQHDNLLFNRVDNPIIVKFDDELFLQLLRRTKSRELFIINREIRYKENLIKKLRGIYLESKENNISEFNLSSKIKIEKLKFKNTSLESHIKKLKIELSKASFFKKLLKQDFDLKRIVGKSLLIDKVIPIAFSGICMCRLEDFNTTMLVNCLPYKKSTLLVFGYPPHYSNEFESFFSRYSFNDGNSIQHLIEVLSVRSTDNLFINIDFWDNLNIKIREQFLYDFVDSHDSFINVDINYSFLDWN